MGKRSRRDSRSRQLPPPRASSQQAAPARLLLEAIADGDLDDHLTALADAVNARCHLVHTVRSATALGELCVGDHVRINHTISPKYLRGQQGRVVAIDDERVTVCLHRPIGRFHSGEIRCPPLTLDRLARADAA